MDWIYLLALAMLVLLAVGLVYACDSGTHVGEAP